LWRGWQRARERAQVLNKAGLASNSLI
jgi:hypothetical protein